MKKATKQFTIEKSHYISTEEKEITSIFYWKAYDFQMLQSHTVMPFQGKSDSSSSSVSFPFSDIWAPLTREGKEGNSDKTSSISRNFKRSTIEKNM